MNEFKTTKIVVDNIGQQNARDFWKQFDNMQDKINNLQSKIDKVIDKINQYELIVGYYDSNYDEYDDTYSHGIKDELLDILKEDK